MITSTRHSSHAFTLLEMAFSLSIAAILLAAVLSTFSLVNRGFVSAGNYFDMEQDARMALENLCRDARQATGLVSYAPTDITLAVATEFSANGAVAGSKNVRYYQGIDANSNVLYRLDGGSLYPVCRNVTSLQFTEFDRNLCTNGIQPADCKLLQVNITLQKYTINTPNTEQILSARIVFRNKLLP